MKIREVALASLPDHSCSDRKTMVEKRHGIATFEFEKGHQCSIAGQRGVGPARRHR